MTRVGWTLLALFALGIAALASMTRVSGAREAPAAAASAPVSLSAPTALPRRASARSEAEALQPTASDPKASDYSLPSLIVPVAGVERGALTDTWGQARSEGRVHHGTDIPAPRGTAVIAAAPGTIEKLYQSARGGTTLYERSSDQRWTFYYAHLAGYAPGLHEGQAVSAGELLGFVGDTGDAGAGNYHLHFGLTHTAPEQHWYQGEDINAYPALARR